MAKLYGRGTKTTIVPGKKYRLEMSCGRDPKTGIVYESHQRVPDEAYAVELIEGDNGRKKYRRVAPALRWKNATPEQRSRHRYWQTPVKYQLMKETFMGTSRQADRRLEEMRAIAESGVDPDAGKMTYAEISNRLLTNLEQHGTNKRTKKPLTNSTKSDYRNTEKHIVTSFIGLMAVGDITRDHIVKLFEELRGGGLGERSLCKVYAQLNRVFTYARRTRAITFNPCEDLDSSEVPSKPRTNRTALSLDDAARLARIVLSLEPDSYNVGILLGVCNGMRIGEILGLSWKHVSLGGFQPYLLVTQQYTEKDGTHNTKADESHVTPLDSVVVSYLRRWKSLQANQLNELGIESSTETPVCTTLVGSRVNTNNFETHWRKFCVANGFGSWKDDDGRTIVELSIGDDASMYEGDDYIVMWHDAENWPCDESGRRYSRSYRKPKIKKHYVGLKFHELRHTYFTRRMQEGDLDLKTLQALGGWTTPDMLLRVYAHSVDEKVLSAGGYMDKLLARSGGE